MSKVCRSRRRFPSRTRAPALRLLPLVPAVSACPTGKVRLPAPLSHSVLAWCRRSPIGLALPPTLGLRSWLPLWILQRWGGAGASFELRASLIVRATKQLRASQSLRAPAVLSGWEKVSFGAFSGNGENEEWRRMNDQSWLLSLSEHGWLRSHFLDGTKDVLPYVHEMSCRHYYIHSYSSFSFVSRNCVWNISASSQYVWPPNY